MLFGLILLYLLLMETKPSQDIFILVKPDQEPELRPKSYKVIDRNEDDILDSFQGWRKLPENSALYSDEEFLDQLNCSLDSIWNESSVIVESKHDRARNISVQKFD